MLRALLGEHCWAGNSSRLRKLAPAFLCGHGVPLGQLYVRQSRRTELADRSRTAELNTSPKDGRPLQLWDTPGSARCSHWDEHGLQGDSGGVASPRRAGASAFCHTILS